MLNSRSCAALTVSSLSYTDKISTWSVLLFLCPQGNNQPCDLDRQILVLFSTLGILIDRLQNPCMHLHKTILRKLPHGSAFLEVTQHPQVLVCQIRFPRFTLGTDPGFLNARWTAGVLPDRFAAIQLLLPCLQVVDPFLALTAGQIRKVWEFEPDPSTPRQFPSRSPSSLSRSFDRLSGFMAPLPDRSICFDTGDFGSGSGTPTPVMML